MKKLAVQVTALLIIALATGAFGCAKEVAPIPTPNPTPTPTPTPSATLAPTETPAAINWASVSERINRLATDTGLDIHEVHQLTDDTVEIWGGGGCTGFAEAIDNEPEFVIVGKPQLSTEGNCTIWLKVLPPQ